MFRIFFLLMLFMTGRALCNEPVYNVVIGSMFRDEAPYLKEWIEYHRLAGVEHFFLYNDRSVDNWQEVLQPYIEEGLVEVTNWPTPEGSSWVTYQVTAFRDAMRRSQNVARWIALVDIDEFILPLQDGSIRECLEKHFNNASGVYVNWRNFGTGGVYLCPFEPILPRLTAASLPHDARNGIGKSIVRPEAVALELMWYPHHFPLKQGVYLDGAQQTMTFSGTDLPTDGKHHDEFIRINHYYTRDETFFQKVRRPYAIRGGWESLVLEWYHNFSKTQDFAILDFINRQKQGKE